MATFYSDLHSQQRKKGRAVKLSPKDLLATRYYNFLPVRPEGNSGGSSSSPVCDSSSSLSFSEIIPVSSSATGALSSSSTFFVFFSAVMRNKACYHRIKYMIFSKVASTLPGDSTVWASFRFFFFFEGVSSVLVSSAFFLCCFDLASLTTLQAVDAPSEHSSSNPFEFTVKRVATNTKMTTFR